MNVGVKAIHVDPPYNRDSIVYRIGSDSPEVGFYAYHQWAAPLTRMLPGVVADALSGIDGLELIGRIGDIDNVATVIANSTKPLTAAFEDPLALEAATEMAAAVRGGLTQLKEKPYFRVRESLTSV